VFLDPGMPPAQWVEGRRRFALGDYRKALTSFTRASLEREDSLVFVADQAAALLEAGQPETAMTLWASVDEMEPFDPRFTLGRARAAMAAGQPSEAGHLLDMLSTKFSVDPDVAAMRVAIADALGTKESLVELLLRWQDVAPTDPEPVRRRIALLVEENRLPEALSLTDELVARGQERQASSMAVALATGLHDWDRAIAEAESIGLGDTANRLRARRDLESAPDKVPSSLENLDDPAAATMRGQARLLSGDAEGAIEEADKALETNSWDPDALAMKAEALDAAGRRDEGQKVLAKLRSVDPR
jgi:tetratricopeptide (TPR) repeat protein